MVTEKIKAGIEAEERGLVDKAVIDYKEAIQQFGDAAVLAMVRLGGIMVQRGIYQDADKLLRRPQTHENLLINEDISLLYRYLGHLNTERGKYLVALIHYQTSLLYAEEVEDRAILCRARLSVARTLQELVLEELDEEDSSALSHIVAAAHTALMKQVKDRLT